jgi:hypothetical protein
MPKRRCFTLSSPATDVFCGKRGVGIAPPNYFREWRIDDLRTLVLNSILWSVKLEVPAQGVRCPLPELGKYIAQSVEPTWLPPRWRGCKAHGAGRKS